MKNLQICGGSGTAGKEVVNLPSLQKRGVGGEFSPGKKEKQRVERSKNV